jgi:hypothetical protein
LVNLIVLNESIISPDFFAEITLFPTAAGGRAVSLPPLDWRTVVCVNDSKWSVRISYTGSPSPNTSFYAGVQLLYPEHSLMLFIIGQEFTVWDGGEKAVGRVLEVVTQL